MKSLNHFFVKVEKRFNDTLNVAGKDIYLESKFDEFENRICFGEIVSAPLRHATGAKEGDTLFFHHHVTTTKDLSIGDDTYIARYSTGRGDAIAYRCKDTGEISMLGHWIFVVPTEESQDVVTESGLVSRLAIHNKNENLAKMFKPSDYLSQQGVTEGSIVCFTKDADYKMTLDDGSVVFRMTEDNLNYVKD